MPPELTNQGKYEPIARAAARTFGIDESFFVALLTHENATWDPTAPSYDRYPDGRPKSIGIGQITEETARELGLRPEDRSNPELAIAASAKMVSRLYKKYGGDWWKVYAAYNAGDAPVDQAIRAASASSAVGGPSDWRPLFRQIAPTDYSRTLDAAAKISEAALNGGADPNIYDFANAARNKTPGAGNLKPLQVGPPDINDDRYTIQSEDGSWVKDYESWSRDNFTYYQSQKLKRDLEEGPESSYFDDVIKEISANIAAGQYGLEKAKTELNTRTSVFNTIAQNAADLLGWALPAGATSYPRADFYAGMGLPPTRPETTPIDLFGMGLDLVSRSQELTQALPNVSATPATQALSSLYGGGAPGSGVPSPTSRGAPPTNLFSEALDIFRQSTGQPPSWQAPWFGQSAMGGP